MESEPRFRITSQLILGVAIVVVGVLFTLDNLHILNARDYLRLWPAALIAIGLVHISQARTGSATIGGVLWIFVGGVLLGNRLGILHANVLAYWPLLLVVVGLRIVWQTFAAQRPGPTDADSSGVVSAVAVMGGFDRRIVSKQFRGGELTAFWGGGKLDLREAIPADGGRMVVNVFALMGGFEIIVPETWSLSPEVTPFMGGIEDKTRPPANPSAPTLVVRGFIMMSGVTIKN
jgi:predicted membrane protein